MLSMREQRKRRRGRTKKGGMGNISEDMDECNITEHRIVWYILAKAGPLVH